MSNFGTPEWAPFMGVGEVDLELVGTRNAAIARAAYAENHEPYYAVFDPSEPVVTGARGNTGVRDILLFPTARILSILIQSPPEPIDTRELWKHVQEVYGYSDKERAKGVVSKGVRDLVDHGMCQFTEGAGQHTWIKGFVDLGNVTFSPIGDRDLHLAPYSADDLSLAGATVLNPVGKAHTLTRARKRRQDRN